MSSRRRISDETVPPRVKSGSNYQNRRLAGVEAQVNGYDDAVLLAAQGKVAEAAGATLMLVRDGELITPPVTDGMLERIRRQVLMNLYKRGTGRDALERVVDRTELCFANEVFLCPTVRGPARPGSTFYPAPVPRRGCPRSACPR